MKPALTGSRQKVMVHLYRSSLRHESRIERACRLARALRPDVVQVVIGVADGSLPQRQELAPGVVFYRVEVPTKRGLRRGPFRTMAWERRVWDLCKEWSILVVSVHSSNVLSLGAALARSGAARLVYEPHELESHSANTPLWQRWMARWTEARLVRHCDRVVVVSDSIADWYRRAFRIPRPTVVRNVPDMPVSGAPSPTPSLWRTRFGIADDHMVFIYQGALSPGRRIEQFLRVFAAAQPDRHVVFMGYGELESQVRLAAERFPNIHFAPAVAPKDVLRHTAGADVGLVGVENVCLSYFFSLPNKLFEYIAAGVPALVNDWPEMKRVVLDQGCGWVVPGDDDAAWLCAVDTMDWAAVRRAAECSQRAADRFSWTREQDSLRNVYASVLGPPCHVP
jgi:glycosyltransferase involved in cell wall biosynthesis